MELRVENVSKRFKNGVQALTPINLVLSQGVYGLLGPNGAGKSTLMKILTGNLEPTQGQVCYDDVSIQKNMRAYCHRIGYVPQNQGIYAQFTARQFLWYMAALKGLPKRLAREQVNGLLVTVGLEQVAGQKLGGFSGGMKQRVLIAQALLGKPEIIILDEPTAGLDPMERIHIRNFISNLASEKIILLSTHVVSDVADIAKQIILLSHGKILFQESAKDLCEKLNGHVFICHAEAKHLSQIKENYLVSSISELLGGKVRLRLIVKNDAHCPFKDKLLCSVAKTSPDLQDVYLAYLGESGRDGFSEGVSYANIPF
ncbi:putative ABC transporter ATP-binding protein [Oscillibacter valericigenes Sjm18-20]|nr:putative ABC transporter ATP-binding protein [Oscillibacter valericigenes Sjm18-20]